MPSLESGRRIADRYLLQDRLGDGGHAEVWLARDTRDSRRVALKFLHLRSCSAEEALRVLRHESRMASLLDHPGVLSVGEPQRDGRLVFLPMDYAGGGDASRLRGASWQQVVPVLQAVAQVLEHAHARGVVHRDIKPGNVLFDDAGAVRLADFGTAARIGGTDAVAMGSPFSASPQQLRDEPASPADDVYGLGALAYELLTRYPPFYPHLDAARAQHEDPPAPEPVYAAPAGLLALVQAMLARDPAVRPGLDVVIVTLDHYLAATDPLDLAELDLSESAPLQPETKVAAPPERSATYTAPVVLHAATAAPSPPAASEPAPQPAPAPAPQILDLPEIVEEPRRVVARPVRPRRRWPRAIARGGLWTVMAATAAAAALLWLPTPGALRAPEATATVAAEAKPPLKRVEEAVVVPPVVAQGTPPEAATNTTAQAATAPAEGEAAPLVQSSLDDELRAGREALAAAQPAQARAAFQRALALQPDQAEAKVGMVEAASLEGLLAALAQGTRAEAAGDFDAARERYQAALAQRASFQPARTALARVEQQQREVEFDHLLAAGREALRLGRIETAQAAYLRASAIHPDDARVQDGGQRLAEVLRSRQNGADLAAGAALEREERWDDALAHYKQVLARDSKLRFAQEGFTRSEGRAALERELQDYLARPERLTAPAVGQAAQRALARGEAQGTGAPRLQQQLAQLRKLLGSTAVPVRVALTSDNNTLVTVMELGELGSFVVRELTLPPGDYTIVGRRTGFRDVRYELRIAPGQPIAALTVQCTEPII